ncbi:MAG: hypothetical protein HYT48_00120 [Candidatus Vogelbacteria bacterium]|nr:hypothetical protein [Candidatus Vogelbacteria bacterium]
MVALIPAVHAQVSEKVDISDINKTTAVIDNAANAIAIILFALSAIFIIVSALFYLTAAGNQEQLKRAKDTLIYAIVGVVLGLIAFSVKSLVPDILK